LQVVFNSRSRPGWLVGARSELLFATGRQHACTLVFFAWDG